MSGIVILHKQQVVMHRSGSNVEEVTFTEPLDEPGWARRYLLASADHEDMGYPEVITVTIEPGDLLNGESVRDECAESVGKPPSSPVETTAGSNPPELHPRNSIALGSESMPNTKSGEDEADGLRLDLLDALVEVGRLSITISQRDATIARMAADLLAKDDTIERLWRQLNEATNVPDHNDPEFGFDKTAALSDLADKVTPANPNPHCSACGGTGWRGVFWCPECRSTS